MSLNRRYIIIEHTFNLFMAKHATKWKIYNFQDQHDAHRQTHTLCNHSYNPLHNCYMIGRSHHQAHICEAVITVTHSSESSSESVKVPVYKNHGLQAIVKQLSTFEF